MNLEVMNFIATLEHDPKYIYVDHSFYILGSKNMRD